MGQNAEEQLHNEEGRVHVLRDAHAQGAWAWRARHVTGETGVSKRHSRGNALRLYVFAVKDIVHTKLLEVETGSVEPPEANRSVVRAIKLSSHSAPELWN